jgi:hypothetical protein
VSDGDGRVPDAADASTAVASLSDMTERRRPGGDPSSARGENTDALYSLFCGVIALPTAFIYLGALFGVAAVMLGWRGLERAYEGEGRREMAIAGLALGMIAILVVVTFLIGQITD